MFGFINLNKPPGFTSHDCIAKLRKILNTRKIGHGGTLDPAATGVLPIAVGKATRLLQFLPEPKVYQARIRLGVSTTTDDLEGEIIAQTELENINLTPTQIKESLKAFIGTIEQVPPIYSAIKKDGRKLYELARKGEKITVEPRTITIYSLDLIDIDLAATRELRLNIKCSPGTYIRAIARDLGKMLGVGGTLAHLIRLESCGMHIDDSLTFEEIETQVKQETFQSIAPSLVLQHLAGVTVDRDSRKRWCQGQLIDLSEAISTQNFAPEISEGEYISTYSLDREFLGISILFKRNEIMKIKPKIVCADDRNN